LPINGGVGGAEERAIVARGRTKPLDGEEPVITLRIKVVRCEGLAAKDRSGTSDP
jgi:phosphatidylserine decarboxylase